MPNNFSSFNSRIQMDDLGFTEAEIREQLEILGYRNVSDSRLREFKRGMCENPETTTIFV